MAKRKWRLPLHIPVAVLFSLLILGVGATISLYHFNETRRLLDGANHALFQNLADHTRDVLVEANDAVRRLFILLSASALADARNAAERLQHLPEITGLLGAAPLIESVVVGYGNGDLFLVRRPTPGARPPEAKVEARWIVLDVRPREGAPPQAYEHAFDAGLRHLGMRAPDRLPPEPRLSDWYRLAASTNGLVVTPPRPFTHAPGHGPSFAQRNGATVFAVNVDLSAMSALLRTRTRTPSTQARLLASDHSVLASAVGAASEADGVLRAALADYRDAPILSRQLALADERPWHVSMAPMPGFGSEDWILAVATPDDEIFAAAYRQRERSIVFTALAVLLSFPLAWALSRLLTTPLHRLADQAHAVSALQFDARSHTHSVILEVDQLADAMALMSGAIARFLEMGHRLGLSRAELARRADELPRPLPVEESLLQDRLHHVVPRPDRSSYEEGNPWGITMRPPEHPYNHGELYNLRIRRGTLTEEERFKIREHIVETMIMLSRLPFPPDLAAVPEMACAHHETMDGRGYPRGLRGEQMSGAARVIAIADIFEALTATDRPYKDANSVAEALSLMREMAARREIDAALFTLFEHEALRCERDEPRAGGAEDGSAGTHRARSGPPAVTQAETQASFP